MIGHFYNFAECYRALTDHNPLRWQSRLYDRMLAGDFPATCDIPTGLGKTSVIPIWLIAVASHSSSHDRLPRRLAYIVNRRTVVDQATSIVEQMRERLRNPEHEAWCDHKVVLSNLATQLGSMAAGANEEPFGVSTLRGELADNEEWKADPARPAIIVGTIDMIGSKLLFSGYGNGRYGRAHHAGLIGQDALIVHDEAHLTLAFSELLRGVAKEQERTHEPRRVRIMELSATQRRTNGDAIQLEAEDESDEQTGQIVKQRLDAKKRLHLHKCDDLVSGLVEKAKSHVKTPGKVLIYVRSPEDAQKVAAALWKDLKNDGGPAHERVGLLTGTIRGHERDRLVAENPVYRALLDPVATVERPVFLVSTSAGEVGIDLDADHLVCDLTTLDSMIQRLGRVNRRGGKGRDARADVVWTENDANPGDKAASPIEKAVAATLPILQRWADESTEGTDVSPRNLRALVEGLSDQDREAAFSPKPDMPPLTDILLDNWSLTSIDSMPGRPEVVAYLHGLTNDPPETYVTWRKEVLLFKGLEPSRDELSEEAFQNSQRIFNETLSAWFRVCRIEANERLRDRTDRVRKVLDTLLKAHRKREPEDAGRDFPIVLLDEHGRAQWSSLSAIIKKPDRNERDVLRYRTVVLPVEAGGLDEHGVLDAKAITPIDRLDVAEVDGQRARRVLRREVCEYRLDNLSGNQPANAETVSDDDADKEREIDTREFDSHRDAAEAFARKHRFVVERIVPLEEPEEGDEDEGTGRYLLLMLLPRLSALDNPERAPFEQSLDEHTKKIVDHMTRIADALWPEPSAEEAQIKNALVMASEWHDRGKDRPVWQRFARNDTDADPLAKSTRYLHGRALGGYRHEFGSLLEAVSDEGLRSHPERDLIMHLIAAHHGWARPHFEPGAFDHEGPRVGTNGERRTPTSAANETALIEALQRFGQLQQRFGRWGLAWLESLVRCADIAASKQAVTSQPAPVSSGEPVPEEVGT